MNNKQTSLIPLMLLVGLPLLFLELMIMTIFHVAGKLTKKDYTNEQKTK